MRVLCVRVRSRVVDAPAHCVRVVAGRAREAEPGALLLLCALRAQPADGRFLVLEPRTRQAEGHVQQRQDDQRVRPFVRVCALFSQHH